MSEQRLTRSGLRARKERRGDDRREPPVKRGGNKVSDSCASVPRRREPGATRKDKRMARLNNLWARGVWG